MQALDRQDIPDGLPFIVDDDGSLTGCDRLNTYLLTAWRQRAYDLDSLRSFHAYHPARLLRFVRQRRGGELVDLTATTTEDLTAYRDARQQEVLDSTLATEFGLLLLVLLLRRPDRLDGERPDPAGAATTATLSFPQTSRA